MTNHKHPHGDPHNCAPSHIEHEGPQEEMEHKHPEQVRFSMSAAIETCEQSSSEAESRSRLRVADCSESQEYCREESGLKAAMEEEMEISAEFIDKAQTQFVQEATPKTPECSERAISNTVEYLSAPIGIDVYAIFTSIF